MQVLRPKSVVCFCIACLSCFAVVLACFRGAVWIIHASRNSERWSSNNNTRHFLISMHTHCLSSLWST